MRSRYTVSDIAIPVRPIVQRTLLIALLTGSLLLLFSTRLENGLAVSIRSGLVDIVAPVVDVLSKPVEAWHAATAGVRDVMAVYQENKRLTLENQRLLEWQATALKLEAENQGLRGLLQYAPRQAQSYVTAKVVGWSGNSLSQRLLIDAGQAQGVALHQAVVTQQGVIGRVVTAGEGSAEVMLLTDMNSRIPVVTEPSGIRSILAGDRSELPHLAFLSARQSPQLGERVVTSADGDLFPAGLPVGKLFAENDGQWQVRPFADLDTVRYVQVVLPQPSAAAK